MDNFYPLNYGNNSNKVLLSCTSQKNIPKGMSLLDNDLYVAERRRKTGTDYVKEYVKKEEEDALRLANFHSTDDSQSKLDDVSCGTAATALLVDNEDSTKLYKTYNFEYHLKFNLPITSMKDKIVRMIETNSVVIIQGPTGCGKTTQVPQFILDSCQKKKEHCNIIVTQPRRIAAVSIAKRVSQERNWPIGTLVGYQVGLIHNVSQDTRLTYCTTGVLLHKLINNKNMLDYTHVILDEVHERDQDMDFLLLVIRKFLRTNSRTVKVILMSATFEVEKFANYFASPMGKTFVPAPIIDIAKRNQFDVTIFYLCQLGSLGPLPEVSATEPNVSRKMMEFCTHIVIILDDVDMKADRNDEGDISERHVILIFLPGIHEIEEMHNFLTLPKYANSKWDIVVLHSSITNQEQQRIFFKPPEGYRRIILSTNIAESSITVPDVKYIIDFCLIKHLVTDPVTNFQSLEMVWASKTNCEQRAGRTGRVMDGRVYRLVPRNFYETVFPREGSPEMLRAPLENIVLKSKILDMGEPKAILALALDPPDFSNLERTILLLKEAGGLINETEEYQWFDGQLTDLGRVMASLPLDIHASKLIMLGQAFSVLRDTIIIAASMALKDMFSSPFRQKLLAYTVKQTWAANSGSDCIAFMNVYKVWASEKASGRLNTDSAEKQWALRNFVQIRVLREVKALVSELTMRLKRLGIEESVGMKKVVWNEKERPFALKMAIAGACYPNYFIKTPHHEEDELEGVKLLNGLDPRNTVYLTGWPIGQPGPLYARTVQEAFKNCLTQPDEKVKITFDNSSRIYVQFCNSKTSSEVENANGPTKIHPSVYRAIKMRQSNMNISIPILSEDVANQKAEELRIRKKSRTFFPVSEESTLKVAFTATIKPVLPKLTVSRIPIIITTIINPGHFWVQLRNTDTQEALTEMQLLLNDALKDTLKPFNLTPRIGTLVIAPYEKDGECQYFRGIIESYKAGSQILADVLFVDYGFRNMVRLSDIRKIDDSNEITKIPAFGLECVLAKIRPSITRELDEHWTQGAYDIFQTLINRGLLFGDIYSVVDSIISLELLVKCEEDYISINEYLVNEGFAMTREENYFSRNNHDLRKKSATMLPKQCSHYEQLQYNQKTTSDFYPIPPSPKDCIGTVHLKGPFSPLEMKMHHLSVVGRGNAAHPALTSVNSVLLDCDPAESGNRLLVAVSISQSARAGQLTLYNTTLMPNFPGLMTLITLTFTPQMELRRNDSGTRYIGALCGLGYDNDKKSLFPEHDIELQFDVEITVDDLKYINRLRHWLNIGMTLGKNNSSNNMDNVIFYQNKIKEAFLKLMEKHRKVQNVENIYKFNEWGRYPDSLYLHPNGTSMVSNNIYKLHNALRLEEGVDTEDMKKHIQDLRALASEDPRKCGGSDISCKLCNISSMNILSLRAHLYSTKHREKEENLKIHQKS